MAVTLGKKGMAAVVGSPQPARSAAAGASGGIHTVTDPSPALREGPPRFKPTGHNLDVGARVEVIDEQKAGAATWVSLKDHHTGAALGWTAKTNLGDVHYAKATPAFVYVAAPAPRKGFTDRLPVMVYLSPGFDGAQKADVVIFFHGDDADYSSDTTDNFDRENPAIGGNLAGAAAGAGRNTVVIAPQVNEWQGRSPKNGDAQFRKSPWHTLSPGDFETIVQTALDGLQDDLGLTAPLTRGSISITGHSGGGKALGQAALDLDQTGDGVTDVTLQEAGYGGGEDAKQKGDGAFATSFQLARDWLLQGNDGKVLRVVTKAGGAGTDTRHAIENPAGEKKRIPVLGLDGVKRAIAAKGLDATLTATSTEVKDTVSRNGGMRLIRKLEIARTDGAIKGSILVFLMKDPPRAAGIDPHFGVRDNVMADDVKGKGQGDTYGTGP